MATRHETRDAMRDAIAMAHALDNAQVWAACDACGADFLDTTRDPDDARLCAECDDAELWAAEWGATRLAAAAAGALLAVALVALLALVAPTRPINASDPAAAWRECAAAWHADPRGVTASEMAAECDAQTRARADGRP